MNQNDAALGGQWNLIGTVTLNAGTGHYVEVSSENGQASADAVRLVSTGPASLSVVTTSLSDGFVGLAYSETLVASGGDPPYTWSVIGGMLPAGLSLNSATGEISGIPMTVGSETFTVRVEDDIGDTADAILTINVVNAPTEIIIDNLDPNTEQTGTWVVSSGLNPWAGQSVYNNGGNFFRWLPTIPSTGTFDVYAWWTFHSNRSTTVPYRIAHAGGVLETIVNQHDAALGRAVESYRHRDPECGHWTLRGGFERERPGLGQRREIGVAVGTITEPAAIYCAPRLPWLGPRPKENAGLKYLTLRRFRSQDVVPGCGR